MNSQVTSATNGTRIPETMLQSWYVPPQGDAQPY
jgi:hypothetical protein